MLYTGSDGHTYDSEIEYLEEVLHLLDGRLERLLKDAPEFNAEWLPPDSWDIYDSAEHTTGLGLVACQSYLAASYSYRKIAKAMALKSGPVHPCGLTIAEIINHAANYWKHHDEWNLPFNKAREKRARETLAPLLAVDPDYPLTTILRAVVFTRSNRLQGLLPHVRAWRDDMLRTDPTPTKRPG